MIPGKKYTPDDVLQILWRHKWLVLLPTLLVSMATILYTRTLPNRYRSETVIVIQPPRVRADLVRAARVTDTTAERVQAITQQVMTRTRLETIITDLNLYPQLRRVAIMEDIVERMRDAVDVQVVRGEAFRVSFESDSPVTAMRVTERLARLFIDENLRDREMLAEGTSQFLGSQLEDARRRLVETEKRLEAYRRRYSGELPSQLQSNLTAVGSLQTQGQAVADGLARERDRLQQAERALSDLVSQAPVDDPADSSEGAAPEGSARQQLAAARKSLSDMELRLKPQHPDIARMKRVVSDLERKAEAEALQAPLTPTADATKKPGSRSEVVRRRRIGQLEEDIRQLRQSIAEKESDQKRLREVIGRYQQRADAAPTRETELIELTRDHETLQKLYTTLLSKNEESKLAVNMETRQIGEQFRIVDPARVPQRPFSPNRLRLNFAGTGVGLALGLGFVLLLEWRDTSLKTDDDVKIALGLPVLALVPLMQTSRDLRRARRWRWAVGVTAGVVLVAVAAAAYLILRT